MKYEREDINGLFVLTMNVCEPEHPYADDNLYPITEEDVKFGWCQSTSRYWAKCGPRKRKWDGDGTIAYFGCDIEHFNSVIIPRILVIMGHEVSHITEGSHSAGSSHNPKFWREMVYNCTQIMDNINVFESFFNVMIDVSLVAEEVIEDPNSFMVDRRMETVEERKEENRELVSAYL